jgi:hypothetical protein
MNCFLALTLGALLTAAAAGWGWLFLTACGRYRSVDPDRILTYPMTGLLFFCALGSILWMAGGFVPAIAYGLLVPGIVFLGIFVRRESAVAWTDFRSGSTRDPWRMLLWGIVVVLTIPTLLAPDSAWDSNTFHLVIARETAAQGSLPLMVDQTWLFNFLGSHPLLGWGFLLAGPEGEVVGRTVFVAHAFLGLALVTRTLGRVFSPGLALAFLGLVAASPVWLFQMPTAMVDVRTFTWSAAGLALMLKRTEKRWDVLGLLFVGAACGTKHPGIIIPGALAVLWAVDSLRTRSFAPFTRAASLGLCCILFALPWFWKNEIAYGNPFFLGTYGADSATMARYQLFERPPAADASAAQADAASEPYPARLVRVLARLASGKPWGSSLHPCLFLWAPFALVAGRSRRLWPPVLLAGMTLAGFAFVVPCVEDEAVARYFLNTAAPLYFIAALGYSSFAEIGPRRARIAWVMLAVTSLPTFCAVAVRSAERVPVISGVQTLSEYWQSRYPSARTFETINRDLTPRDRLFCTGISTGLLRIPRAQIVKSYLAYWTGVRTPQDLGIALDRWGITWVLVNDTPQYWAGLKEEWIRGPESPLRHWTVVEDHDQVKLYKRPGLLLTAASPQKAAGGPGGVISER